MEVLVYLNEKHGGKLYLLSQLNLSHGINSTDLLQNYETRNIEDLKGNSANIIHSNVSKAPKLG